MTLPLALPGIACAVTKKAPKKTPAPTETPNPGDPTMEAVATKARQTAVSQTQEAEEEFRKNQTGLEATATAWANEHPVTPTLQPTPPPCPKELYDNKKGCS